jgi:HEAT repeat protein
MKRAMWVLAAALPLAAQPKLLVNAQTDTRSAAAGLEREYRTLLASQPQPAWMGYSVPAVRTGNLGCDYVRDSYATAGVVHLEPPDHAVILFRVENNALNRVRTLSPDCEIDAGGVPVHWLNDVQPAQSIALLTSLVPEREGAGSGALQAISVHADPAAEAALERFLAPTQPENIRLRTVSYLAPRNLNIVKKVIAGDPDSRVRERAVSSLANSRQPEALDLLISIAKSDNDPRLRSQAISGLGRKSGAQVVAALTAAVENDRDPSVRRRALSSLQSMPDGEGVPVLIQLAKSQRDLDLRKQAMTSLQHSRDPRALAFFEEVIKR